MYASLAIQRSSSRCLCRWWFFWLNTNWLISCRTSKSLGRTLPRESQITNVRNSSGWCSDPISSHSNGKIGEFKALALTKLTHGYSHSSFLTIPLVKLWSLRLSYVSSNTYFERMDCDVSLTRQNLRLRPPFMLNARPTMWLWKLQLQCHKKHKHTVEVYLGFELANSVLTHFW